MRSTFRDYIHIPPVSITLAYIPVTAADCLFGIAGADACLYDDKHNSRTCHALGELEPK